MSKPINIKVLLAARSKIDEALVELRAATDEVEGYDVLYREIFELTTTIQVQECTLRSLINSLMR